MINIIILIIAFLGLYIVLRTDSRTAGLIRQFEKSVKKITFEISKSNEAKILKSRTFIFSDFGSNFSSDIKVILNADEVVFDRYTFYENYVSLNYMLHFNRFSKNVLYENVKSRITVSMRRYMFRNNFGNLPEIAVSEFNATNITILVATNELGNVELNNFKRNIRLRDFIERSSK
ncbi:hypothetical protein ACQQ97_03590 [Anaerovoracaceae bacterium SGI.195]